MPQNNRPIEGDDTNERFHKIPEHCRFRGRCFLVRTGGTGTEGHSRRDRASDRRHERDRACRQHHFNTPKYYSAQILLGYFTSPSLELGGQLTVAGADGTSAATNVSAFADYYLAYGSNSPLLPYVGITAGYAHYSGQDSTSIGGEIGAKYFLNSNVAVNAKFQYVGARNITGQSDFILGLSTFIK